MPKHKNAPKDRTAAAMPSAERCQYLAQGELDPTAQDVVDTIKLAHSAAESYRKNHPCNPFPFAVDETACKKLGPKGKKYAAMIRDADQLREQMIASQEEEIADTLRAIRAAILGNNAALFRAIADVLAHYAQCNEREVTTPGGNSVLFRDPADRLGTNIAFWFEHLADPKKSRTKNALWEHLCTHPDHKRTYSRLTYKGLKSAQEVVRRKAVSIGYLFDKDKHGPKP